MIPCKEALVLIETVAKKQGRLFDDSCDFGLWTDKMDPSELAALRAAFREIRDFYGFKADETSPESKILMFVPFEQDGTQFDGVSIAWTITPYRNRTILNIGLKHESDYAASLARRFGFKG